MSHIINFQQKYKIIKNRVVLFDLKRDLYSKEVDNKGTVGESPTVPIDSFSLIFPQVFCIILL